MSMSLEARLYYFACNLLWSTLSSIEYLMEQVNSTEARPQINKWYDIEEELADWSLKESIFAVNSEKLTKTDAEILHAAERNHSDPLFTKWTKVLLSAASSAHAIYPTISDTMWLYYYYCRWISYVLSEFDRLLQESELTATKFHHRYQENIQLFKNLTDLLRFELSSIYAHRDANQAVIEVLADLETNTMQLSVEWREAILEAATNFKL